MDPHFLAAWAPLAFGWVFGFPAVAGFVLGAMALDARLRRIPTAPRVVEPALA